MKFESLIFDIDGTIWDSRALVAQGYNRELSAVGHSDCYVTPENLAKLFGKTSVEIADIMFASIPVPERYELIDRCMAAERKIMVADPCDIAYPGVVETLRTLAKNHRLFLVSNSDQGYPELCMEKLGISDLFSGHLCYGDTRTSKGQTILRLMAEHGIESAVYIGDTQGDYEATVEAGIPFFFAAYGFGSPERFDGKIERFADLPELLED